MATYGMDTAAGLAAGTELERGSQEIAAIAKRVDAALASFDWTGEDADRVRQSWVDTQQPVIEAASQQVSSMALTIRQEAGAQDDASSEAGVPAGGAAGSTAAAADDTTDGRVLPQVAEQWSKMTTDERRAALQEQARRLSEQYGIQPPPEVRFEDLEDEDGDGADDDPRTDSQGSYTHGERVLRMDVNDLGDPNSLNTMAHEMRHAAQNDMADQYRDMGVIGRGLVDLGIRDDPFVARGSTMDEVGSWNDNFSDYQRPEDDFGAYESQPVEADARNSGDAYADNLTPSELESLRRGVPTP